LPDGFLRHNPQPGPFIWDEHSLNPENFLPHVEDQMKIYSIPHPEQFEPFKHLNEGDKEMMEKQKQWQEKYGREMEKQHKKTEEKRNQLLKEYRDLMKKYKAKE